jgi:hypothetical protein
LKAVHLLLLPVRSARLGYQELQGSAAFSFCCLFTSENLLQKTNSLVSFASSLQGLQDKMELVAIDLQDKPAWYKDKVYPQGTVCWVYSCSTCPPS